jgi:hypothetical protein
VDNAQVPFDTPLLEWLDKPYTAVADRAALFGDIKPEIMGESLYLNGRDAGISLALCPKQHIQSIFLYAEGVEDFAQYVGHVPQGLSFGSARMDVCAVMGEPAMSADAGGTGIFAIDYSFDRFERDGCYIRFEYTSDATSVRLITLGKVEA